MIVFIGLLMLVVSTISPPPFCSGYCKMNQCSNETKLGCTDCDFPFVYNPASATSTCQIDSTTNWIIISEPANNEGVMNYNSQTTCGDNTLLYGLITKANTFKSTISAGTSIPHWQAKIIYWVVISGNTLGTQSMITVLDSVNTYQNFYWDSANTQVNWCASSGPETYLKISADYTHNTVNSSIQMRFDIDNAKSGINYGVKDIILLIRKCHDYCASCTGDTNADCQSCITSGVYESFYFNNTCYNSSGCPSGYYAKTTTHTCAACTTSICKTCFNDPTNCTSCNTGKYLYNNSCLASCPNNTVTENDTCVECDQQCLTCLTIKTNCTSCPISGIYEGFLNINSCVSNTSCPVGQFASTTNHICTNCDLKCTVCTNSATNCSSCNSNTSSPNEAFLDGNTCVVSTGCSATKYANVTTHTCLACDSKCTACFQSPTNCSACSSLYFLTLNTCVSNTSCPVGQFANTATNICTNCDLKCTVCTNSATNCSSCNSNTSSPNEAFLDGNTCVVSTGCSAGTYAKTSNHKCSSCFFLCSLCNGSSTNCSSCVSTGSPQGYLLGNACVNSTSCGSGNFSDSTTHICQPCNSNCLTCLATAFSCTSCNLPQYLYNNTCYITCPNGTLPSGTICLLCDSKCLICSGNSTNCSSCQTVSPNQAFLQNFSCVTNCTSGFYQEVLNHTCTPCSTLCLTCQDTSTFCYTCVNTSYYYDYSCRTTCPSGTYAVNATNTTIKSCQPCRSQCSTCNGGNITNCLSCSPSLPYKLSGTTCNESCLAGYGVTLVSTICVKCKNQCLTCSINSTYCPTCVPSGGNRGFYMQSEVTCYGNCPNNFFENYTTNKCQECNFNCAQCDKIPTNCTGCYTGTYLFNFSCGLTCPALYFKNVTTCSPCNTLCLQCTINSTYCLNCNTSKLHFFLNNSCYTNCPNNTYENISANYTCTQCDSKCSLCENLTSCTGCNNGYFLYLNQCLTSCPLQSLYADVSTNKCLDCQQYCVGLNISLYFFDSTKSKLIINMKFNRAVNFTTLDYQTFQSITFSNSFSSGITLSKFNVSYVITSNSSYQIILEPIGYIFLHNETITVTTISPPSPINRGIYNEPFKLSVYQQKASLDWYLLQPPPMSNKQRELVDGLSAKIDQLNSVASHPVAQHLKNLGILTMILPGIQITSAMILVNNVLPKNLYVGIRMMAVFVFPEAPDWEKDGTNSTYFFTKKAVEISNAKRILVMDPQWRIKRTGNTTMFAIDNYIQIFMLMLSWIILVSTYCYFKKKRDPYNSKMGSVYSFFHRVHEVSLMYLTIGIIMEWIYFEGKSIQWGSFIICMVVIVYFLGYQLYMYYDLHQYADAKIGTTAYNNYAIKYGSMLSKLRFQDYPQTNKSGIIYSIKLWIRPYNYHLLSFYKKILMIAALPLFHSSPNAQTVILITLQILQIIRFFMTWPYLARWRNIGRLVLQFILLGIFIIMLITVSLTQQLMNNDPATVQNIADTYYFVGWIGFGLIVTFNLAWIGIGVISLIAGCMSNNKDEMNKARKQFYFNRIVQYQQKNKDIEMETVNDWVRSGNLNQRQLDEDLKFLNPKIEELRIKSFGNFFEIKCWRIVDLKISKEGLRINEQAQRLQVVTKTQMKLQVTEQNYPQLFNSLEFIKKLYKIGQRDEFILKTYIRIQIQKYEKGGKIAYFKNNLNQKLQIYQNRQKKVVKFTNLLQGFPLDSKFFF